MTPLLLARMALRRLPRPYTEEVSFHVFCELERTPHLRKAYDELLEGENAYTPDGLNKEIGKAVRSTLNASANGQIDVRKASELVKFPSKLTNINPDWKRKWENS